MVTLLQSDNFRKHKRLYPSGPKTNLHFPQLHPSPFPLAVGEVGGGEEQRVLPPTPTCQKTLAFLFPSNVLLSNKAMVTAQAGKRETEAARPFQSLQRSGTLQPASRSGF